MLQAMRELGVGLVPFAPLGRGFLTGTVDILSDPEGDMRLRSPRFTGRRPRMRTKRLRGRLPASLARDDTGSQVALAWVCGRSRGGGSAVVPIPGTKRRSGWRRTSPILDVPSTQMIFLTSTRLPLALRVPGAGVPGRDGSSAQGRRPSSSTRWGRPRYRCGSQLRGMVRVARSHARRTARQREVREIGRVEVDSDRVDSAPRLLLLDLAVPPVVDHDDRDAEILLDGHDPLLYGDIEDAPSPSSATTGSCGAARLRPDRRGQRVAERGAVAGACRAGSPVRSVGKKSCSSKVGDLVTSRRRRSCLEGSTSRSGTVDLDPGRRPQSSSAPRLLPHEGRRRRRPLVRRPSGDQRV